jgi:predicted anti-sigma-YlaC factor YlaD
MFKSKSECQKVKGLLSPYIDHQLTSSEQGLVEAHLERCQACRMELESLRAVVSLVHRVPLVSPPRSFAIAEAVPRRRAAPVAVLSAATAVAVLLLAFFFVGDALNLFSSEVPVGVEERLGEAGSLAEPFLDMAGAAGAEPSPDLVGAGDEIVETVENWPFWQLEIAFSVLVVVLGAMTLIWWLKRRKVAERG